MKLLAIARSVVRAVFRRSQMERDMEVEMQFHIDARAAELMALGMPATEAEWLARQEFGDIVRWKEQGREARGLRLVDELQADLRYAARTLRRSPGFALTAIVSLALGIGANTAIFSLLDLVLLKPLPVRDPASLVQVAATGARGRTEGANIPWFNEVARRTDLFSEVFAIRQNLFKVQIGTELEFATGQFVTGTYYQALGVQAALGRVLSPQDQTDAASNFVAVISHAYWRRRFAGNPGVLGTLIVVDRRPYTIVGVTGPEFFGLQRGWTMDVTMPFAAGRHRDPSTWSTIPIIARLKPGVEPAHAESEMTSLLDRFTSEHVKSDGFRQRYLQRAELVPFANGQGVLRKQFLEPLRFLVGAVGILLLIACVNLAGLLAARNTTRHHEFGIRMALGAGRMRVVRQLLTESALLAALGAVPAVVLAWWGSTVLIGFVPDYWGPLSMSLTPDGRVLAFAACAAAGTTALIGVLPAFQATRGSVASALATGHRRVTTLRIGLGRGLVVVQFALSLVLVAAAVLLVRTLVNLDRVDAGFRRDGVLIVRIDEPGSDYENERMRQFQWQMRERLGALPV